MGTQVVTIDYGSWDHHTDIGTVDDGELTSMVRTMSESLAAFFTELGADAARVTLVTISEFGRTISENGSAGAERSMQLPYGLR